MEEVFLATNVLEEFVLGFAQYHLNSTTPKLHISSESVGKWKCTAVHTIFLSYRYCFVKEMIIARLSMIGHSFCTIISTSADRGWQYWSIKAQVKDCCNVPFQISFYSITCMFILIDRLLNTCRVREIEWFIQD